jgi:hypothetical protein
MGGSEWRLNCPSRQHSRKLVRIPVFVSCPTALSPQQQASRAVLIELMDELNLEPRALGRSDYPSELPLREVLVIAQHCAGGLILGFEQFQATAGTWKRGMGAKNGERKLTSTESVSFPTPWNHLEAGILFGLGLPVLIFREEQISGGVFDNGVTDVFIHKMPGAKILAKDRASLKQVVLKWYAKTSARYYGGWPPRTDSY